MDILFPGGSVPEAALRRRKDDPQHPLHQDPHPETGRVRRGKAHLSQYLCTYVYVCLSVYVYIIFALCVRASI